MTTGKTIALIRWTFVGKVMPLLFNILSRLNHELPDTQAGFRKGNHEEVLICYKIRVYYVSGTMLMWNILFNANNLQRWVVLCIYFSLLPFYYFFFRVPIKLYLQKQAWGQIWPRALLPF